MVTVSEEFSFPAIFSSSDDLSANMASSSLWRISSKVKDNLDDELGSRRKIFRRSFCKDYYYYYYYFDDNGGSDVHSMDLLWENFNEEKNCSESLCDTDIETEFEGTERNVSKEITVFKTAKKKRMVTVLKAVKKLLLLGNMAKLKRRELDS